MPLTHLWVLLEGTGCRVLQPPQLSPRGQAPALCPPGMQSFGSSGTEFAFTARIGAQRK